MRRNGFTIIELMITVAIVAILAAVAVPSYTEYVRRSRITDATSTLSSMRIRMEQHFQDNRTWATGCQPGTISAAPARVGQFNITCTIGTPPVTYEVIATGVAGSSMDGADYRINERNVRTSTPPSGWANKGCGWVLKKDGSC